MDMIASASLKLPLAATLVVGLLYSTPSEAAGPLIERVTKGNTTSVINWGEGFVETTAHGTARYTGNRVQEKLMALQAARTIAQARLVEVLEGVRVTGMTTVETFITTEQTVVTRVSGFLAGAITVKEEVTWEKDTSSKRGEVPEGRVTLRVCLTRQTLDCRNSDAAVIDVLQASSETSPSISELLQNNEVQNAPPLPPPSVTGLILDLERQLFLPVLSPEVVAADGAVVFNHALVTKRSLNRNGVVHYANSVDEARPMRIAGNNPMIVKVVDVTDNNRIVVSSEDARRVLEAARHGDFLTSGRVVIVLD